MIAPKFYHKSDQLGTDITAVIEETDSIIQVYIGEDKSHTIPRHTFSENGPKLIGKALESYKEITAFEFREIYQSAAQQVNNAIRSAGLL